MIAPELFDLADKVRVGRFTFKSTECVVVEAPGIFRLITNTVLPKHQVKVVPRFYPGGEFCKLWLSRDDPGERLVLADWLEDVCDPYSDVLRANP